MSAIAIPKKEGAVTVAVRLNGILGGDVLVVQFPDAETVEALLRLAEWLEQQKDGFPRERVDYKLAPYSLSADLELPAVRTWLPARPVVDPDDLPYSGVLLLSVAEPNLDEGDWTHDFVVCSYGTLIIGPENASAEIDLNALCEQMR